MLIRFPYYQEQQSQEKCSAWVWNSPRGTLQLLLLVTDAQDQILKLHLHIPKILITSTTRVIRRYNIFLKHYMLKSTSQVSFRMPTWQNQVRCKTQLQGSLGNLPFQPLLCRQVCYKEVEMDLKLSNQYYLPQRYYFNLQLRKLEDQNWSHFHCGLLLNGRSVIQTQVCLFQSLNVQSTITSNQVNVENRGKVQEFYKDAT